MSFRSFHAVLLLGLCFAACLNPALSLQCYIEGPQGGVFAYVPKPSDIPSPTCLSYKYDCSKSKECKAAESGKWVYTVVSKESCAGLLSAPTVYKNAKCCTTDKCNAPDPSLDPVTKIIPRPAGFIGGSG
jgi:hypothetical protein